MAQGRRSVPPQAAEACCLSRRGGDRRARLHDLRRSTVKLHSTNPIERLEGEIKRRTEMPGIFPNENAIVRLISAILLEQNDEWTVPCARYMTMEAVTPLSDERQPHGSRQLTCPALAGNAVIHRKLKQATGHDGHIGVRGIVADRIST